MKGWTRIDRENRNNEKKRKMRERKERKKEEITLKAKRMAGIGPITDLEIEQQRKRTGSYEKAKDWAAKAHLARHYRYNQEELDTLTILETKRTNRDEIMYIAVADEKDINDIYGHKAECKSDDTIVRRKKLYHRNISNVFLP